FRTSFVRSTGSRECAHAAVAVSVETLCRSLEVALEVHISAMVELRDLHPGLRCVASRFGCTDSRGRWHGDRCHNTDRVQSWDCGAGAHAPQASTHTAQAPRLTVSAG